MDDLVCNTHHLRHCHQHNHGTHHNDDENPHNAHCHIQMPGMGICYHAGGTHPHQNHRDSPQNSCICGSHLYIPRWYIQTGTLSRLHHQSCRSSLHRYRHRNHRWNHIAVTAGHNDHCHKHRHCHGNGPLVHHKEKVKLYIIKGRETFIASYQ